MSKALSIHEKIAICDKAIKQRFGQQSGLRRARGGYFEVIVFRQPEERLLNAYNVKAVDARCPIAACKRAGVEVDA